jgi:hypothetical protein
LLGVEFSISGGIDAIVGNLSSFESDGVGVVAVAGSVEEAGAAMVARMWATVGL